MDSEYGCTTFWYAWNISLGSLWVGSFRKSFRIFPCYKLCFIRCESDLVKYANTTKMVEESTIINPSTFEWTGKYFLVCKFLILSEEMPYMVYSYVTRIVSWIPKYRDFDKIEDTHFCWFSWSILIKNNSSFNVKAGCSYNVRSSFQVKVPALSNTIHSVLSVW